MLYIYIFLSYRSISALAFFFPSNVQIEKYYTHAVTGKNIMKQEYYWFFHSMLCIFSFFSFSQLLQILGRFLCVGDINMKVYAEELIAQPLKYFLFFFILFHPRLLWRKIDDITLHFFLCAVCLRFPSYLFFGSFLSEWNFSFFSFLLCAQKLFAFAFISFSFYLKIICRLMKRNENKKK